jgi:nitroreductase
MHIGGINKEMDNKNRAIAADKIGMLRGVRQVRQFRREPVPDEVVNDILEVARWTGSGMNAQPWEFVLVRDHNVLTELATAEGANSHLAGGDFAIVVLMEGKSPGIESFDEGRLTERLLLAAAAHGVGAGIWWFKDGGAAARRLLGIPEERPVRTAISFGYPDTEAISARPKRPDARKPMSEIVHEGQY